MKQSRTKGFTIIELMIATIVFSLILLVVMGAIIQFGRIYYKGVIQSRTQERARAISEDIAKHIQFGKTVILPSNVSGNVWHLCAGARGYTYNLGQERSGSEHGLVGTNGCGPYSGMHTQSLLGGATEMLGENMQLAHLRVTNDGDRYTISVRVAYGEDGDFEKTTPTDLTGDPANSCRPITFGGQFCATSELTTTVTKRLK